ncbi:PepSY-associated TM helix domain-containing protein [Massilia sp. CCM 8734]|uniref:PepSY-associated TM helix domain-containing protein n=1 Tax=Massilia sp. CCM 8734 TaxID=2609283 RepID=UPI00141F321C|nr:PepSY-associated TM helix domain-containing protein [Massilia sp. CCM 8734]NHZ94222.1 PepSY domain-containing protein [Massilia sp. CCM 8734]
MKSSTLKTYIALHTWVGLVAGFALFIAFYAGAITVFTKQLHTWETPSSARAPIASEAGAQALIDAVLHRHPSAEASFTLLLPSVNEPHLTLDWDERDANGGQTEHQFRLAPDGALLDVKPQSELSHFLYRLHYTAGLPASWGIYVLGLVCILYGLALASGVVAYAPLFLKDLFALRIGKNLKRMWQDAHNVIGILSLPFHIVFAWSGAVLALGVLLLAPFQFLVFDGKLLQLIEPDIAATAPLKAAGVAGPLLPADQLLARVRQAAPGMLVTHVYYQHAGDANAHVIAYGDIGQRTLTSSAAVVLKAGSGAVVRVMTPQQYSPGTTFLRGLQTLHYGNFGHVAVQWMYFVLGLAGAFLFYSGNLLWIEARRKRQAQRQPLSGRLMAQATLGVCLGCVAGVSAVFLVNKLFPAAPGELPLWEERGYYAVFLASLAWAFIRPPARAAWELLALCATLTLAIPLAQWAASGVHPLLSLWRGQWVVAGVNAVALVAGCAFWKMGRAALRRGRDGDLHSVWSLRAVDAPGAA